MVTRTNKQWIANKKKQQSKTKWLKKVSITEFKLKMRKLSKEEKIECWYFKKYKNPKWNVFSWNYFWQKYICCETDIREDPDWYRIILKPNSKEVTFIYKWLESWSYKKWIKKQIKNK